MSSTTVTGVGPARGTIRNGVGGSKVSGSDMVPQASHHVDSSSRLRLQSMFVEPVEHRDEGHPSEVEFAVRRTRHERHGTSDPRERLIGLNGSNTIGVGAPRSSYQGILRHGDPISTLREVIPVHERRGSCCSFGEHHAETTTKQEALRSARALVQSCGLHDQHCFRRGTEFIPASGNSGSSLLHRNSPAFSTPVRPRPAPQP